MESQSSVDEKPNATQALLEASARGATEEVKALLRAGADTAVRDGDGRTALHFAAANDHLDTVCALLEYGHQWNVIDKDGKTAGDFAKIAGSEAIYERLVEEGVRVEMILGVLGRGQHGNDDEESEEEEQDDAKKNGDDQPSTSAAAPVVSTPNPVVPSNKEYLDSALHYSDDKLLDADNNAVMMGWEGPLMDLHTEVICYEEGLDILNVGFGLGIVDTFIQKKNPRTHTIIEAHPDVYKRMIELGWDKKPGVRIVFGRWQDVLDQLDVYDGIFFDTFGEFYEDLRQFNEHVPNLLRQTGVYSFFNGLCGTNQLFHDVYCRVAELDLADYGLSTQYVCVEMDSLQNQIWDGVKRKYWSLETYNLPICKFIEQ
eukprot:GILK01007268.1.p1 GENE.GILK01007268.1~~GILK01007268.1.p1  ORF type:complete len:388 (+),score=76.43 GILK01007268.1:49-1164(+)